MRMCDMRLMRCLLPLLACSLLAVFTRLADAEFPKNYVAGELVTLTDNGAWSWFMDERAMVADGKVIVGSVRAVGEFRQGRHDPNWGNVELGVHDLDRGTTERVVLHPRLEQDDHNVPALLRLPDGRILAVYTRDAVERKVFHRYSPPGNPLEWGPIEEFETPGRISAPFSGDNVTYSNLFRLSSGRILNFFRGPGYDPNYLVSADDGRSWTSGGA